MSQAVLQCSLVHINLRRGWVYLRDTMVTAYETDATKRLLDLSLAPRERV